VDLPEKALIDPSQRGAAVTAEARTAAMAVMKSANLTMLNVWSQDQEMVDVGEEAHGSTLFFLLSVPLQKKM
jgi:hypothetical protein